LLNNWYDVKEINDHIYVIRERLDKIEPRFLTIYTNIFLIVGNRSAILFDTGSGYQPISPIIYELIGKKDLIVINSHNHFDHVGNNNEFSEIFIHRFDLKRIIKSLDISFLKSSNTPASKKFELKNFKIESSSEYRLLIGDEIFNLGDITVKVIFTPGHTPGSICLITDHGELFTGDTINYGAVYLPDDDLYYNYKHSLEKLMELISVYKVKIILPAHENFIVSQNIVKEVYDLLTDFQSIISGSNYDQYLDASVTKLAKFTFIFQQNYKFYT